MSEIPNISQGRVIAEQMIRTTENCIHFKAGPSEFGLPVGPRHADEFAKHAIQTTIAIAIDQAIADEREACAKIADKAYTDPDADAELIAYLIRERGKP